jgi:hypothetical protein
LPIFDSDFGLDLGFGTTWTLIAGRGVDELALTYGEAGDVSDT